MENIRNFAILAHIDHGKSTLADRFLELTGTVDKRHMKAQYLDQLELERERGITIKMAPVRMNYILRATDYALNLIDTPGHSDFYYEVSRALAAVEGVILLVDVTQGIQAQTLANFHAAKKAELKIIGAVNKIDLNPPMLNEVIENMAELLGVSESEIFKVSAKTGQGVKELLGAVVQQVPAPAREILFSPKPRSRSGHGFSSPTGEEKSEGEDKRASCAGNERSGLRENEIFRALIFDSFYHEHKGIVASVRVFGGEIKSEEKAHLIATDTDFKVKELGYFVPQLKIGQKLENGQIGYIATGLKDPEKLKIGDTIIFNYQLPITNYQNIALPGYKEPQPVVFVSFYPEESDNYEDLKNAFGKLKLNDSALKFEPDFNEFLGRGLKAGFLGRLHFEITAERLEKEFNIKTIHSFPSVAYKVKTRSGDWTTVNHPKDFPDDYLEAMEPIALIEILIPSAYLGSIMKLQKSFRLNNVITDTLGNSILIKTNLPLSDLIRDFDDQLKSASSGYASLSYSVARYENAEVAKLDIKVAGQEVSGLTRIIHKEDLDWEARRSVEKLKDLLPRQQFKQAIQAVSGGRILAREDIPAFKKDVTGYLYGGDRTRKMKLWKKQKRGKEKLKEIAGKSKIDIPASVFKELLKK